MDYRVGAFSICFASVSALGCLAEAEPLMTSRHSFHDHDFSSDLSETRFGSELTNMACNNSAESSAFNWRGVMGVDSFSPLPTSYCARQTQYGALRTDQILTDVDFQDGSSASVDTIRSCRDYFGQSTCGEGLVGQFLYYMTTLDLFSNTPDEIARRDRQVSIRFENNEDGTVTIGIFATDDESQISSIVFNESVVGPDALEGFVDGRTRNTLRFLLLSEAGEAGPPFLLEDTSASAVVIAVDASQSLGDGVSFAVPFELFASLGTRVSLGMYGSGVPAVSSIVSIPSALYAQ